MKNIIFISPGPTFRPRSESYQSKYRKLSKDFAGFIWTTSSKPQQLTIGNFEFKAMQSNYSLISNFKFLMFCLLNAIKVKKNGTQIHLVTTYDPLKTGLIGLMVARIIGAKFAPEVNGMYTSEIVWMDCQKQFQGKVKHLVYPLLMRCILSNADGIKLLFPNQIDIFRGITRTRIIRHFPDYVPTSRFANMGESKEVLFAGFPFKIKGVDLLIEAFKIIAPKYPDWKLKILGWFPNITELQNAIDGHSQIYHHPPVHYNEMPKHIGSCGVFVLPSRSEAMGRVLVEAMAAGKPRIGSNVDGIPTVINNGVDGLLVEPENVVDLANKLDLLMGDEELRKRMGEMGARRAREEFTEEKYVENLISFYKAIIES